VKSTTSIKETCTTRQCFFRLEGERKRRRQASTTYASRVHPATPSCSCCQRPARGRSSALTSPLRLLRQGQETLVKRARDLIDHPQCYVLSPLSRAVLFRGVRNLDPLRSFHVCAALVPELQLHSFGPSIFSGFFFVLRWLFAKVVCWL